MLFWEKVSSGQMLSAGMRLYSQLVGGSPVIPFFALDRGKHFKSLNSNSHCKSPQNLPEENSTIGTNNNECHARAWKYALRFHPSCHWHSPPSLQWQERLADYILRDCLLISPVASASHLTPRGWRQLSKSSFLSFLFFLSSSISLFVYLILF